jgi:hypothetical protein
MSDSDRLRASDADRERAAEHLREHFSEGRLSSQEFSDRLDAVYAATTLGELAGRAGWFARGPAQPTGARGQDDRHERRRLARQERRDRQLGR